MDPDHSILDFFMYKTVSTVDCQNPYYLLKLDELIEQRIESGPHYRDGDMLLLLLGFPPDPDQWPLPVLVRRGRSLGIHILLLLDPLDPDPTQWMLEGMNVVRREG